MQPQPCSAQVCTALGCSDAALSCCVALTLDHSLPWPARLAAAALLSRVVASGGLAAEAAVRLGAFEALVELMDRDTYPYYRQV